MMQVIGALVFITGIWMTGTGGVEAADRESLGPSSRRTGLVISEIMYHPAPRADGKNLEFIELYNSQPVAEKLGGWRLSGTIDYFFPSNTVLNPGTFLVVAKAPADVQAVYGIANVAGGFTNSLQNSQGAVRLHNRAGAILLEAQYSGEAPWPASADGAGHSLVLARPSYGEGHPRAWAASQLKGGSLGTVEPASNHPWQAVVINEFLAHTDWPQLDFIELYNHGSSAVDLSGCFLSDDPATNKFTIPNGVVMPPRGFLSLDESELGFALNAAGETIYLISPDGYRVIDAVKFAAQANGVSSGRHPDGAGEFYPLGSPSPGQPNGAILISPVVINELMYNPISHQSDDEYVELYNQGAQAIDLSRWRFVAGIDFEFPSGASIAPGGYLVVAKNSAQLVTNYANLNFANTLGGYRGSLANGGERVALARPELLISTNQQNEVVTNTAYVVVDEVTYADGGRWGRWSDGGGSSLELIDAHSNHRLAANWADSDETAKSEWTVIENTGVLDNGAETANALQILMQGAGEVLVDNVEVLNTSGVNLVSNPGFESGLSGWVPQGNHSQSGVDATGGYQSSRALHVRAGDRGDTGANRIRTPLTAALNSGVTATIRAKVRWLKGHPEILLRLKGNYLEAYGRLTTPHNLGTPGARNSRAIANAGPAIYEVQHFPILPTASQAVVVSARVDDPDGLGPVVLKYRVDPSATLVTLNMVDNGAAGDAIAGDGVYSATIPGQASGVLVAFQIQAQDQVTPGAGSTLFPADAPARECLIRFGETQPAGALGTYRLWMTKATFDTWTARSKMDNTVNDVTFVYNNQRAIYNSGALFAGSPHISPSYSTPSGNLCGYTVGFPDDDPYLGATAGVLDWPGRDATAQQEPIVYWIAKEMDLHYNYRRFIHLHVNGVNEQQRGSVYEDTQQPSGDSIASGWPNDTEGPFYKIEQWFEFNDAGTSATTVIAPTLQKYTTTGGVKKLARYRWNWLARSIEDSANNYQDLFTLVDAATTADSAAFTTALEGVADMEQWMRIFAVEHLIVNFDSYGYDIGKNMYAYKPLNGRWQMMMFDIDWVMLASASGPFGGYTPTSSLFSSRDDPLIPRLYAHPPFLRAYWRAIHDAVEGPLKVENHGPWMDTLYAALQAGGVTRSAGSALTSPAAVKTWLASRRAYCQQQLAAVAANFAITSNNGNDFATNRNLLTLQGAAPIEAATLKANGVPYPVTWTTVTNWQMLIPLHPGVNALTLEGCDRAGQAIAGYRDTINVNFNGLAEPVENRVVFNEIMYRPTVAGADYVELFNISTNTTVDLFGWRINGLDFTFASGSFIAPQGYGVVARNRSIFANAYGPVIPVLGVFAGNLDNGGETLTLLRPLAGAPIEVIINRVRYDDDLPWPRISSAEGPSLQLIDPCQDNSRAANWAVVSTNNVAPTNKPPEWQYVTATGTGSSATFYVYLTSAGDVYIDDLKLVEGSVAGVGTNYLSNGDFESPLSGPWTVSANHAGSAISTTIKHSGNASLHLVATSGGTTKDSSVWQTAYPLSTTDTYTLSYWYLPSTNGSGLRIRLSGFGIDSNISIQPEQINSNTTRYTPGAPNSTRATLADFPPIWINEVAPQNIAGATDQAGHHSPWVELYNSGDQPVALGGFYLTDSFTNLNRWAFPAGAAIQPKSYLVIWADGEAAENQLAEPHTHFRLPPANGMVALAREQSGQFVVLDYLHYGAIGADQSWGSYPEGQALDRQVLLYPTPGGTNRNDRPPAAVTINEWMAGNNHTIADPADGRFQDWFELYNAGAQTVDLSGYFLTDDLTNTTKFAISPGTTIAPRGFLLVWADEETGQNQPTNADLHVNFKLSQTGEAIALFAPEGTRVDAVVFGPQTNDVSEGRWPDGQTGQFYSMPLATPRGPNRIAANPGSFRLTRASVSAGHLMLSWEAEVGARYRMEYKNTIQEIAWQTLQEVTATSPSATLEIVIDGQPERYFRLERVP